jgi:ribosomal-protein-alanine N-acetyltransferase
VNPAPCAITLRPARLQEAATLAAMSRDLIEAGLGWRYTALRMAALIGNAETLAVVACEGPQIHGFAVMSFGDIHAHLMLLCVQPAQRRCGIGRRLHDWLVESARIAGIESIQLELRADNAAALSLYKHLGYAETALVPGYYAGRVAALRMTLQFMAPTP